MLLSLNLIVSITLTLSIIFIYIFEFDQPIDAQIGSNPYIYDDEYDYERNITCFADAKFKIAYPIYLTPKIEPSKSNLVHFLPNKTLLYGADFKISIYTVISGSTEFFPPAYKLAKEDDAILREKYDNYQVWINKSQNVGIQNQLTAHHIGSTFIEDPTISSGYTISSFGYFVYIREDIGESIKYKISFIAKNRENYERYSEYIAQMLRDFEIAENCPKNNSTVKTLK